MLYARYILDPIGWILACQVNSSVCAVNAGYSKDWSTMLISKVKHGQTVRHACLQPRVRGVWLVGDVQEAKDTARLTACHVQERLLHAAMQATLKQQQAAPQPTHLLRTHAALR